MNEKIEFKIKNPYISGLIVFALIAGIAYSFYDDYMWEKRLKQDAHAYLEKELTRWRSGETVGIMPKELIQDPDRLNNAALENFEIRSLAMNTTDIIMGHADVNLMLVDGRDNTSFQIQVNYRLFKAGEGDKWHIIDTSFERKL